MDDRGYGGIILLKMFIIFFEKYTPLPRGMGVYFQSNSGIFEGRLINLRKDITSWKEVADQVSKIRDKM